MTTVHWSPVSATNRELARPLHWRTARRVVVDDDLFAPDVGVPEAARVWAHMIATADTVTFEIKTRYPDRMKTLLDSDGFKQQVQTEIHRLGGHMFAGLHRENIEVYGVYK